MTDSDQADIHRSLGRIEGKLDALNTTLTSHTSADAHQFAAIDTRLSSIERKQAWVIGAGAGVATVISFVMSFLKFR